MSKKTRASKIAHIERRLDRVNREVRSIETSSERASGSQLVSALGLDSRRHPFNPLMTVVILERVKCPETAAEMLEEGTRGRAVQIARSLQLYRGVPLREALAECRHLRTLLSQERRAAA